VYDPWVNDLDAQKEFDIQMLKQPDNGKYDAIIISVAHDEFKELSLDEIKAYGASNHVLYDVKCILSQSEVDGRL
jgi:UDP-N-acetyl-D-mannosaminuronate dehydrogenase